MSNCSYLVDFDTVGVDLVEDLALEGHQLLLPQAVGLGDDGNHIHLFEDTTLNGYNFH